jgi:DNA-binding protein HU-beta
MTKKELVDALAPKTDSSGAAADRAENALVEVISGALKKGDSLTLPGFETFEVRDRAARTGRNPKTGEKLEIELRRGKIRQYSLEKGISRWIRELSSEGGFAKRLGVMGRSLGVCRFNRTS